MDRKIDVAEQKLRRLQVVTREVEKEIRALRQTRSNLQESIKTHIAMYKEVQEILEASIGEINTLST